MSILGNPEEQDPITVTTAAAEIQITHGIQSIEFVNMGSVDVYYGKLSTLTAVRGAPIFSNGGRRTFENIGAGWRISFITASGSANLRRVDYK